jgi:hypothetical protein
MSFTKIEDSKHPRRAFLVDQRRRSSLHDRGKLEAIISI